MKANHNLKWNIKTNTWAVPNISKSMAACNQQLDLAIGTFLICQHGIRIGSGDTLQLYFHFVHVTVSRGTL